MKGEVEGRGERWREEGRDGGKKGEIEGRGERWREEGRDGGKRGEMEEVREEEMEEVRWEEMEERLKQFCILYKCDCQHTSKPKMKSKIRLAPLVH